MNVAILGCGSLGGVMAARLCRQPDLELTVIDSDPRISEAIGDRGLILRRGNRTSTCSIRLVREAGKAPRFDALILATKTNSLLEAAGQLKGHLADGACVVTVQNGLIALDLAAAIGKDRLVPGCVLWGASMEAPGVYRITNSGPFILGGLAAQSSAPSVARAQRLLSRVFPVTITHNIKGALWSKLAITSSFTTLGAITGLPFGRLAASAEIRNIILALGRELFEIARAEGVTFEALSAGLNIDRFLSDRGYSRFLKHLLIRMIGYKNRDDESSMLASLRQGRKTEIDFINGRLVQTADRRGVPVPYNRLVVDLIREMEKGQRQPALENLAAFRSLG